MNERKLGINLSKKFKVLTKSNENTGDMIHKNIHFMSLNNIK